MPSVPEVPVAVTDALVLLTAVLACGMAVSNRLTKRLGAAAAILAVLALVAGRTWLLLALAGLVVLLWLLGRGIPSRRRRPIGMGILAVLTAVVAVVAVFEH